MQVFTYNKANDLSLLHDELLAAGLTPLGVQGDGNAIRVTVEDGVQQSAVDAVVTAHSPAARPPDPIVTTLDRFNDGTPLTTTEIRQMLRFALRRLRGLRE